MALVQVKGATVRDTLERMRRRLGEERFKHLLGSLDEPSQRAYAEPIIASQWYPLDAFASLLTADVQRNEGGDPSAFTKRAEGVFEEQLSGIYRIFIRIGSPETLIKRIAAVHETYFRGTRVQIVALERGRAVLRYTGFDPSHWILDHAIVAFYQKGLEMCGARAPAARVAASVRQGQGFSEFVLGWS